MIDRDNPNRWMNTEEIAALTGETVKHIRELIRGGELPGRRFGKRLKVLRVDYLQWVNSQPQASPLAMPSRAAS